MRSGAGILLGLWFSSLGMADALAQAPDMTPDTIYVNGKIVTVDAQFSIVEALAVRGERIHATGSNTMVAAMAGPATRIVDLAGRTVIPGLIDNHNHVIRATEYWPNEARLDGVRTRREALQRLAAKAAALPPGEWLMVLGGWVEDQFEDSRDDFTLAELDGVAPDRPAFVQAVYDHAYGNTAWFEAMGIPLVADAAQQASVTGLATDAVRDAGGRLSGRLDGGFAMIARAIERFPVVPPDKQAAAIRTALAELSALGLTAIYDPGGLGLREESYGRLREIAAWDGLPVRVFHTLSAGVPTTPAAASTLIERLAGERPFGGDVWLDRVALGEIYYGPFHWDDEIAPRQPSAADVETGRDILAAAARHGWPVQTHTVQPATMDAVLDAIEDVNRSTPVRALRWTLAHADRIGPSQIERLRALGMNLQLRSISVLGNRAAVRDAFGAASDHMPPLRLVQDSAVPFGLGTDGTKAGQINPFVTLWWAVSGKALNGETVLAETLTREEALIAHTRGNAYLVFREADLGSLEAGKLADMVVLDADYLSVPVDGIKDLRPIATFVGGQLVFGSL